MLSLGENLLFPGVICLLVIKWDWGLDGEFVDIFLKQTNIKKT